MTTLAVAPAEAATLDCGDVVVQNTVLEADVGPCPENGIVVMGGVTLNLGGHAVTGTGSGSGTGIRIAGDGARVTNGTVTDFAAGVGAPGSFNSLERLFITANGSGITLGEASTVRQNTIRGNRSDGVMIFRGKGNRIEANVISGNAGNGVLIESLFGLITRAAGNVVVGNSISGNGRQGVAVTPRSDSTRIEQNVISANGGNGVYLSGGLLAASVTDNFLLGNGMNGVLVDRFVVGGAVNLPNTVSGNTARDNGGQSQGFDLADHNADCFGTNWSGNTFVTRNQACIT